MEDRTSGSYSTSMNERLRYILTEQAVWVGLGIRLFLAWFLPYALDEHGLLPGVAYTDIDYHVFSDAAAYIQMGESPYQRSTYRYTPFLAALLALMPRQGGRYIFCLADAVSGWMISKFRRQQRQDDSSACTTETSLLQSPRFQDALWWLYNPLAINICTRGSAESLVVLLPVLLTLASASHKTWRNAMLAGFWHGVAIHAKLYPIIYSLSFMAYFAVSSDQRKISFHKFNSLACKFSNLTSFILGWAHRLLQPMPICFLVTSLLTFVGLTYLAVVYYGPQALDEGLLYHFSRVDHRHNYSMHWYWIYLARAREDGAQMALAGRLLLVPQLVLLVYTSLGIAPWNLTLALFVQTFLFVAFNKVITAQYFTWYLCLLPLCSESFVLTRRVVRALVGLLLSVGFWLGSAYCLEMQGMAAHRVVWMASVIFFGANVNLLGALLESTRVKKARRGDKVD